MRTRSAWMAVLAVLVAVPALAADRVIASGIDPWRTKGDGRTYTDMHLPAGFFCSSSEPFSGRVVFRGVPIATGLPGQLGKADTIVQRLDDAVFNQNGVAVTRVQIRALSFESVAPIKTSCGSYTVKVGLDGPQPITRMRIIQENGKGGRFVTRLGVNVKVSFIPVAGRARQPLEIKRKIRFEENARMRWSFEPHRNAIRHGGQVFVDTNGDRVPDTLTPGTTRNFTAGSLESSPENTGEGCHGHWTGEDMTMHCVSS